MRPMGMPGLGKALCLVLCLLGSATSCDEFSRVRDTIDDGTEFLRANSVVGVALEFEVEDDRIDITFPPRLGGKSQVATLRGELRLFVAARVFPSVGLQRLEITTIDEEIGDVFLPVDTDGDGTVDAEVAMRFNLRTAILDRDESTGLIDTETGEYQLTYVIRPDPADFTKFGIEDVGPIVVHEEGSIDPETGELTTFGSLLIERGYFAGTTISYSPKKGRERARRLVVRISAPAGNDCDQEFQTTAGGIIDGSCIFNPNSFGLEITYSSGEADAVPESAPISSNQWGGQRLRFRNIAGTWRISPDVDCEVLDDRLFIEVEYTP